MNITCAVKELLKIVAELHESYPNREFTLDGRLVGDIGEILVEQNYDVKLYEQLLKHYDGETPEGRKVQIKTTMKNSLTFPCDHIPEYYLGIKVCKDGSFKEIFNGPGKIIKESLKDRGEKTSNNLHSILLPKLRELNCKVCDNQRIKKRIKS